MAKIMSQEESKKWKRGFWTVMLAPVFCELLLWIYVRGLQAVGLCPPVNSWPPDCQIGNIHLTQFVATYVMVLAYTYLFFAILTGLVFGLVVLARISWLKSRAKYKSEVNP